MDAFARLMRAHAALTRELSARLLTDHGLSITDYQCLLTLAHSEDGAMRRVDLAEQLLLTPSGVTRLLDGLERDGWVTKGSCSTDLRVTYAVLTDEGRDHLEAAGRSHVAQVRELIDGPVLRGGARDARRAARALARRRRRSRRGLFALAARPHEGVDRVPLALDGAQHRVGLLDPQAGERFRHLFRREQNARVLRAAGAVVEVVAVVADDEQRPARCEPPEARRSTAASCSAGSWR